MCNINNFLDLLKKDYDLCDNFIEKLSQEKLENFWNCVNYKMETIFNDLENPNENDIKNFINNFLCFSPLLNFTEQFYYLVKNKEDVIYHLDSFLSNKHRIRYLLRSMKISLRKEEISNLKLNNNIVSQINEKEKRYDALLKDLDFYKNTLDRIAIIKKEFSVRKKERLEGKKDKLKKELIEINAQLENEKNKRRTEEKIKIKAKKIIESIQKGEDEFIEFKETFFKNVRSNIDKDEKIIRSSLKSIVAFLNSKGGALLVGIADNSEIKGIGNDFYGDNIDDYKLKISSQIESKIGLEFFQFIEYDVYDFDGRKVLMFECKPSTIPCFYYDKTKKQQIFYYRINPATLQLQGRELLDYVCQRFYKKPNKKKRVTNKN